MGGQTTPVVTFTWLLRTDTMLAHLICYARTRTGGIYSFLASWRRRPSFCTSRGVTSCKAQALVFFFFNYYYIGSHGDLDLLVTDGGANELDILLLLLFCWRGWSIRAGRHSDLVNDRLPRFLGGGRQRGILYIVVGGGSGSDYGKVDNATDYI